MTENRNKWPIVTTIIVVINILAFIYQYTNSIERTIRQYGMYQGALNSQDWTRLIFSAFLHVDIFHIASNMICLGIYGYSLERNIGTLKYILIYLLSVIGSGVLIHFCGGRHVLHVGASGAVWGLMTATLIYNLKNGLNATYALRGVVMNLIYSFSANVSWQGHIGGGLAGALCALLLFDARENLPEGRGDGDSGAAPVRPNRFFRRRMK